MKYVICQVSVSPLRSEASDRSEMVTQILFGEKAEVIASENNWIKLKSDYDDYEGWADKKQFAELSEEEYNSTEITCFASDIFNLAAENKIPLTLPIASSLPNLNEGKISFAEKEWEYFGEFSEGTHPKEDLPEIAKLYLNTPYLWGGKSNFGIDCSGLAQQVYKFAGVKLPRDAYQQAESGEPLSFVEEAEPGDLAFFDNADGRIIHVGIMLEGNKIIHAHGKVRIDPIDSTGIFNTDSQSYSHKLRVIKKIL